ncbi:MAG: hypothetical protein L3J06_04175 [Cyclobacteriaceae bacterium]|nr:hypothetical protein [Cyclobacteriaceae bacterium]
MGTNKRTMKFKMAIILLVLGYFTCRAQDYDQYIIRYSLEEVDSLIKIGKNNRKQRIENEIDIYLNSDNLSGSILLKPMYYSYLRLYSNKIRNKLFKGYKKNRYNRRVLGLLDLPQYMKDSLLNYKHTELEVRAGLGDSTAQNKIVNMYKDFLKLDIKTDQDLYQEFYEKKIGVAMLYYIGTEQFIKIFIEGMNTTDIYEDTHGKKPYNLQSIFYVLLMTYAGLADDIPLISYLYIQNRFLYTESEEALGEEYQLYLRQLEQYFYDKHGVRINIKAPYFILGFERYMVHE